MLTQISTAGEPRLLNLFQSVRRYIPACDYRLRIPLIRPNRPSYILPQWFLARYSNQRIPKVRSRKVQSRRSSDIERPFKSHQKQKALWTTTVSSRMYTVVPVQSRAFATRSGFVHSSVKLHLCPFGDPRWKPPVTTANVLTRRSLAFLSYTYVYLYVHVYVYIYTWHIRTGTRATTSLFCISLCP